MADLFSFLSGLRLFKDFSKEEIHTVMRLFNRIRFDTGEVLAYEGKKGDAMFLIGEGVIKVMRETEKGVAVTLARLGEGEVIGEMALIDNGERSATLVAETKGLVYKLSRKDFNGLIAKLDPAAFKLLWSITLAGCERLREVDRQVEHYLRHPETLYEPEIRNGMDRSAVSQAVHKVMKLFRK